LRRIALIRAAEALAVTAHEGVLGLRAGTVGAAFRVTAEAPERIRPSRLAHLDTLQPGRVAHRLAVSPTPSPAVLRTKWVAEELVADHEERIDAEHVTVESSLGERRVLDQLTRISRVEHAVEVFA